MMRIALYLAAIIIANIITATVTPARIFGFIVPTGTWFIGLTFIFRDLVQVRYGRKVSYMSIASALVVSALMSLQLGDMLPITVASGLAFLVSETLDTEVFTRLKNSFANKVFISGVVGGAFDSSIFVIFGLSPLGAGILPWAAVLSAISGQWLIKTLMQGIAAAARDHKCRGWEVQYA